MKLFNRSETKPDKERRSLNPFPAMGRGVQAAGKALIHENTFLLGVAVVAMVISYGGLVHFAEKQELPLPWLWPIPFDMAAFGVARMARKIQRYETRARIVRGFSVMLVILSVGFQVSTVELDAFPQNPELRSLLLWLWTILPKLAGHGAPAAIAAAMSELALMLQRVEQRHRAEEAERAKVEKIEIEAERTARKTARRSNGSHPPSDATPSDGTNGPGEELVAPPGLSPEELALADQVGATLRESGERINRRTVMPIASGIRKKTNPKAGCSADLAQRISDYLNEQATAHE